MAAIDLESVSKVFRHNFGPFSWRASRRGETRALDAVTLSVAAARTLVLLGPNGSGKTTILKLISGLLLPDGGRVLVEDKDTRLDPEGARRHVGFAVATERSFYPRLTAFENLEFFAALDDVPRRGRRRRIEECLAKTGLSDVADVLVMEFSSGMYQRLGIARALLKRPTVLLLDEPSRSLDPGSAIRLWQLLREMAGEGTAVLMTTHNFEEAVRAGDSLCILCRGRIIVRSALAAGTSVEDLRSLYFREVEPDFDAAQAVLGREVAL